MSVVAFIEPGHGKIDSIKRRIVAAYDLTVTAAAKGDRTTWIEGSIQYATAMLEAKDAISPDVAFKDWLTQNGVEFWTRIDRNALLALASDMTLLRAALTGTRLRSYRRIWIENRERYRKPAQPIRPAPPVKSDNAFFGKQKRVSRDRKTNFRTMKLGEEAMNKIKGTSLDSAPEMDELVVLNRGAPEGEHTEIVRQLIADAAAGKDVSALASTNRRSGPQTLIGAWRKRMVSAWSTATPQEQKDLLAYLIKSIDRVRREEVVVHLMDSIDHKESDHGK